MMSSLGLGVREEEHPSEARVRRRRRGGGRRRTMGDGDYSNPAHFDFILVSSGPIQFMSIGFKPHQA